MERREDVLRQALDENARETERWKTYKIENETAISNLDLFAKCLSVKVMVPIGKKALMPGELIHTNELLVGHYQGYFTACSAYKAKEICQYRLRIADERLKKLEVEADLWQNKLDTPLAEGALPNAGEIEIVEEFNEEEHKIWLKQHKERLRKQKQEERINREAQAKDDIFRKLEESEMMEELGLDPNNFDEQTLKELLNNTTDTKESKNIDCDKETKKPLTDEEVFDMLDKLEAQEQEVGSESDTEMEQNLQNTNAMLLNLMKSDLINVPAANQRVEETQSVKESSEDLEIMDDDDIDEEDSDQPEEVQLIREQMSRLPNGEREEFLKNQIEIIKAKMRKMQRECFVSDELTHLMNVIVCLEDDLQEMYYEQADGASIEELSDNPDSPSPEPPAGGKTRRISFAGTHDQVVFRKNDTVAEMLADRKQEREVIKLDAPVQPLQMDEKIVEIQKPSSPKILEKVEQNVEFVKENQSVQDYDLVNQILEASMGRINTLHISLNHSDNPSASQDFDTDSVPGNPAHFYQLYKAAQAGVHAKNSFPIYVNSFDGEQELKVPILREEERAAAYDDPRAQFSKMPECSDKSLNTDDATKERKSILRNKSAVEQELRAKVKNPIGKPSNKSKKNRNKKNKKERTLDDDLRDMSAYQKVMQDLVEKEPTVPEPLPEGKYIDAHAPKKRISRFKEQRSMNKA